MRKLACGCPHCGAGAPRRALRHVHWAENAGLARDGETARRARAGNETQEDRERALQAPVRPRRAGAGIRGALAAVGAAGARRARGDPAGFAGSGAVPPAPPGARGDGVRDREVAHHAPRRRGGHRPGAGPAGRSPPDCGRAGAAALARGRTAAGMEHPEGRDEPGRAAPGTPGARGAYRAGGPGFLPAPGDAPGGDGTGAVAGRLPARPALEAALRRTVSAPHGGVARPAACHAVRGAGDDQDPAVAAVPPEPRAWTPGGLPAHCGPGRSGSTYLFEGLAGRGDFVAPAIKEGAYYRAPGRLRRAVARPAPGGAEGRLAVDPSDCNAA